MQESIFGDSYLTGFLPPRCRSPIQLRMASPLVYETCVMASKRSIADRIAAAEMFYAIMRRAGCMDAFHVPIEVPVRPYPCERFAGAKRAW
jgi:hypothetical protein